MDTCICMAESRGSSPETVTTLLIDYTSIQNRGFPGATDSKAYACNVGSIPGLG